MDIVSFKLHNGKIILGVVEAVYFAPRVTISGDRIGQRLQTRGMSL